MLRLYSSIHATISSTSKRIYWSRFLQVLLRYMLQHLILYFLFSVSCTDHHLQFEEVGSPAADEAVEEQADTEMTETARASHSQYTETMRGESSAGTTLGDISLLDRSMYYWALAVQTPIEQHIDFDAMQPPNFSPPEVFYVSILCLSAQTKHLILMLVKLQCRFFGHRQSTYMDLSHHRDCLPCSLQIVRG